MKEVKELSEFPSRCMNKEILLHICESLFYIPAYSCMRLTSHCIHLLMLHLSIKFCLFCNAYSSFFVFFFFTKEVEILICHIFDVLYNCLILLIIFFVCFTVCIMLNQCQALMHVFHSLEYESPSCTMI